jgi:fructokinase
VSGSGLIVVAGEALYDLVGDDARQLRAHPGGGPFNAARTLGRLRAPVAFLGRLSTDRFGAELRRELETDAVRLDAVVTTDDPTTLALAEIAADGSAAYRFYATDTSAAGLTTNDTRNLPFNQIDALLVGTLGLVLEPIASTLEELVGRLHNETMLVLDPNCRPTIVADQPAYRARLYRMLRRTDVVKASEEDLAWLCPGLTAVSAARQLLDQGTKTAIITRGARGATVVTHERQIDVPAPRVAVRDTIGAGDAVVGALLAAWHRKGTRRADLVELGPLVEATEYACLVAARTCERAGASPPRLSELPP